MTFEEILDQAMAMLQRRGRMSYRAFQRQFQLDDAYLQDLTDEIVEVLQLAVDQDHTMLVWTGGASSPRARRPTRGRGREPVPCLLPEVTVVLQRDRRVTYRRLTSILVSTSVVAGDTGRTHLQTSRH